MLIWLAGAQWMQVSLRHASVYSGATLLACLLGLVLIGVRKKLVFLPLWSVSTWVQVHLYTGLFACVVFVVHVPAIVASGWFEGPLSLLFILVSSSGVYGVYISRTAPKRLTNVSVQPRFDRIGWHRDQVLIAARKTLSDLSDSEDQNVLESFYDRALNPYFSSPVTFAYLVVPNSTARRRLLSGLTELSRYFDKEVQAASNRLASLVRHRDDLNYQYAIQLRLRIWLVVHAALSGVLVIWSLVHAYIAIAMLGA
jgi:hypothetical protein